MRTLDLYTEELSLQEAKSIEGGVINPWHVAVAAAAVVAGAYKVGEAVGEALYYATN